jgi:hypothetical protein
LSIFAEVKAYAGLLAARLWRAHDIAGDPDDAVVLAEEVQRFDRLFCEADNSVRRKHGGSSRPISVAAGEFYFEA